MEGLIILLVLLIFLAALAAPIMCLVLLARVRRMERRLSEAETALQRGAGPVEKKPTPAALFPAERESLSPALAEAKRRAATPAQEPAAKEKPAEAPQKSNEQKKPPEEFTQPPPIPPEKAQPSVYARLEKEPAPAQAAEEPHEAWLARLGLLPPTEKEADTNLMAWWSTRLGLVLGVIAAVFFGMYINKNTVPWVRLAELAAVAVALFGAGWWLERKILVFGRALAAGGLALLYVAAYAAYGLPAMKVLESASAGALAQLAAIGLIAAWSLLRQRQAVFGLALVLGYVTSWFATNEGLAPIPLVSLLALGLAGCAMFAWRGWWSGIAGALMGSGGGLIVLAATQWHHGSGQPPEWIGLGSTILLTIAWAGSLGWRWKKGEAPAAALIPLATTVGALAGVVVTWSLGIEWSWFYASFAALFLALGGILKTAGSDGLWQALWAKASVLIALLLIDKLGGPSRAFALLAEAGALIVLARPKGRVVYEVGALVAAIAGFVYLLDGFDLQQTEQLGASELYILAYLLGSFVLTCLHQRVLAADDIRAGFVIAIAVTIGLCIVDFVQLRLTHDWAILVTYGAGGAALVLALLTRLRLPETLPVTLLAGSLWWLISGALDEDYGWQSVTWIAAAWSLYGWRARSRGLASLAMAIGALLASVIPIIFAVDSLIGREWIGVALIAVAALWLAASWKFQLPALLHAALLPQAIGGGYLLESWDEDPATAVLTGALLASAAAWTLGWLSRKQTTLQLPGDLLRTGVLVLALLLVIDNKLGEAASIATSAILSLGAVFLWRRTPDATLTWAALALLTYSGIHLLDDLDNGPWHEGCVVLVFAITLAEGVLLGRSRRDQFLAQPEIASVLWGCGGMAIVLFGFAQGNEAAGWTTAAWAAGAVALLVTGFWFGFRGYRVIALLGLGCAIVRLFVVDIQDSLWRIIAFGVTGGLLVGIGYLYHRFHQKLAGGDLDWGASSTKGG